MPSAAIVLATASPSTPAQRRPVCRRREDVQRPAAARDQRQGEPDGIDRGGAGAEQRDADAARPTHTRSRGRRLPTAATEQRTRELDRHRDARAGSGRSTRRTPSSSRPARTRGASTGRQSVADRPRTRGRATASRIEGAGGQPEEHHPRPVGSRRTGPWRSPRRTHRSTRPARATRDPGAARDSPFMARDDGDGGSGHGRGRLHSGGDAILAHEPVRHRHDPPPAALAAGQTKTRPADAGRFDNPLVSRSGLRARTPA